MSNGIMNFLFGKPAPTMLDEDDPRIRAQRAAEAQKTAPIPSLGGALFPGEYTGGRTIPGSNIVDAIIQGNPALKATVGGAKSVADPVLDVLQGSSYFPDLGIDVIPSKQTININRALGYTGKRPGKGGAPTSVQMPNRQRVLNPKYARSQQFGVGRGGAPVRMPGRPALSDRYQQAGRGGAPGMAKSERDPWLTDDDAAFLMSLLDPILNPPAPPTPYGTFGGGGNKAWASLPFLMRGYS
jgi:hypothetical protein